jgi:hypothetical protein
MTETTLTFDFPIGWCLEEVSCDYFQKEWKARAHKLSSRISESRGVHGYPSAQEALNALSETLEKHND